MSAASVISGARPEAGSKAMKLAPVDALVCNGHIIHLTRISVCIGKTLERMLVLAPGRWRNDLVQSRINDQLSVVFTIVLDEGKQRLKQLRA